MSGLTKNKHTLIIRTPRNINIQQIRKKMQYVKVIMEIHGYRTTYFDLLMLGIYYLYKLGLVERGRIEEIINYVEKKYFKILKHVI